MLIMLAKTSISIGKLLLLLKNSALIGENLYQIVYFFAEFRAFVLVLCYTAFPKVLFLFLFSVLFL